MTARTEIGLPPLKVLKRLWAVVFIAYAVWILMSGARYGPDSHTYARWADTLIALRFNLAAYLREQSFVVPPVFYILWTVVIALLKAVLGSSWAAGVLALNWVSIGWGSYVTLDRIRMVTASAAGMLLGVWLLLTAFELLMFSRFVLSDLIYWALSTAVIGAALTLTAGEDQGPQWKTMLAGSALTLVALAFRPVGVPLLMLWVLTIIAAQAPAVLDRFGSVLLAAVITAVTAVAFLHGYLLLHPDRWPLGAPPPFLMLLSDEYRRGVLVYAPESDLMVPAATTVFGAVTITLQKLLYFLTPWLPHFSMSHTLLNLAFFIPAYGLSAVALANRRRLPPAQRRATVLLAIYAITLSAFHAMMQIEFDHRYRLPLLSALIMLSAIGLEALRRPQMLAATARTR